MIGVCEAFAALDSFGACFPLVKTKSALVQSQNCGKQIKGTLKTVSFLISDAIVKPANKLLPACPLFGGMQDTEHHRLFGMRETETSVWWTHSQCTLCILHPPARAFERYAQKHAFKLKSRLRRVTEIFCSTIPVGVFVAKESRTGTMRYCKKCLKPDMGVYFCSNLRAKFL